MNARVAVVVLLAGIASAQSSAGGKDWELVRSVPNGFGGTLDFVLVSEAKQRDREYYMRVSDLVCGSRTTCMVNFWANRTDIPNVEDGWIPVKNLAVMTASYERSSSYNQPHLTIACWLYPSKRIGEADKCAYLPGAKKPPDK